MALSRTTLVQTMRRAALGLVAVTATALIGAGPAAAAPPPDAAPAAAAAASCGTAVLLPPLRNSAGQMLGQASVANCSSSRYPYGRSLRVDDTRANGLQFGLVVVVPDGRLIDYPQIGNSSAEPTSYFINYPVSSYLVCDGLNTSTPDCAGPYFV